MTWLDQNGKKMPSCGENWFSQAARGYSPALAQELTEVLAKVASRRHLCKRSRVGRGITTDLRGLLQEEIALGRSIAAIAKRVGVSPKTVRRERDRTGEGSRCPECGAQVAMPCLACDTRAWVTAVKLLGRKTKGSTHVVDSTEGAEQTFLIFND